MSEIRKYQLKGTETVIEAPIEKFLSVQRTDEAIYVCASVNSRKASHKYRVSLICTGWECQDIDISKYIGTFQLNGLIWHCFWNTNNDFKKVNRPTLAIFSSRNRR